MHDQNIRAHIERYIGPIAHVFSDASATGIDVQHVAPVETRPFHTLVTCGMSARPMPVPVDVDAPRRIELMMTLPERWQIDAASTANAEISWPITLLRSLAHAPHERQSWLGWGHTIPNGDPPRPLAANTGLCGVIIAPSLLVPVGFYELGSGPERIGFYSAIPLYAEEMTLQAERGMEALLAKLVHHDINDLVRLERRNVARRFFGWF